MSTDQTVIHLSQGIDYLGFLNAKLRDLKGWATLANELIQNADDAKGATRITLDVTDSTLIVENDAVFTDCGSVPETRCGLDPIGDGKICCDFHAFRRVASGHKRQENDTTGAFGIGFISVYQITDRPTLRSGHWQWVLRPEVLENERIEATQFPVAFPATRFEFPWANTQTPLRTALGIEPLLDDVVEQMCRELRKALTIAAPFLKRLETLELRRRGKVEWVVRCVRDSTSGEIVVEAGGETRLWKRLTGDFGQDAIALRTRYGASIEIKRKTEVTVAVPIDALPEKGLLYAALPTEHDISLPVLINADFYPSSDRKRILFDQDYQGEWNRAAIRASARALAAELPNLRESLNPFDLWKLFQTAERLHRATENNVVDKAFASFWECLTPALRNGEFVKTTGRKWCSPAETRLLQSAKDETPVLPLLELLGLNIVHLDLQPFATLLRSNEVGVGYLTLDDLTEGLLGAGYDQALNVDQVGEWLRFAENRADLGLEVARLLDKVAKDAKMLARERARRCAVVLTTKGSLAPANQLRRSNVATCDVFVNIAPDHYWAADNNPQELLELVNQFSIRDAIALLRQIGPEQLLSYSRDNGWVTKVIGWFADNRSSIAATVDLQKDILSLSIWPSGGELCSLENLSVPGGFEDRLKLAKILDPEISTRWSSFLLEELGAQELTLRTYLMEHVPRAFEDEPLPDSETRRALLRLLVDHAGDLLDDREVSIGLRYLPIVESQDGKFYQPIGTYFESNLIREVFGNSVRLARVPMDRQQATYDVLAWLGVSKLPRASDLIHRIDNLTKEGPSQERREDIRSLFKGLAENWNELADQHSELKELQRTKWLPGNRSMEWLAPSEVYSVFSRFLFETQAEFLDVSVPVQRKAAADGLFGFLQIQSEPEVVLVVKHLLQLSQQGAEVNMQVYEFLNRHAFDPKINLLKGKSCLYLADKSYTEGNRCYWGMHPFGQHRIQLSTEWRKYQSLLTQLGVSELPTHSDALQVLREISESYADNRQLQDEDYAVVMNCWSILSEHLDGVPDLAGALGNLKVVPSTNHYLKKPIEIFFDDRPGLADKFDEAFRKMIIRRPEMAWRAMDAAGVKFLSSAVKVELVECIDPALDEEKMQRFIERWPLVRRVFATLTDMPGGLSTPPELWGSDRLTVSYRILNYPGPTEDVVAHLSEARDRLYFSRDRANVWGAISRELAFGFHPDAAAGPLAAAIKEVLQSSDADEARAGLDDLGIPDIELELMGGQEVEGAGLGMGAVEGDETEIGTNAWSDNDTGENEDETETGSDGEPDDTETDGDEGDGVGGGDGSPLGGSIGGGTTGGKKKEPGRKSPPGKAKGDGYSFVGRSYLKREGEDEDAGLSEEAIAKRDKADRQGVDKVLSSEREKGRYPTEMPHDNEGYDIESRDAGGQIVRYIEVKSLTGSWNGFGVKMSAPQFKMAQDKKEIYWLYVVEKAASADAQIYRIQNPASKVVEYRFDDGWEFVAEVEETTERRSIRDVINKRIGSIEEGEEIVENNEESQMKEY